MVERIVVTIVLIATLAFLPLSAAAADEKSKGLYISPLRQETSIAAGKKAPRYFTIANLTDKPMSVSFSVKEFSVTDFSYNYQFNAPEKDWVKFQQTQVSLQSKENKRVWYELSVPEKTAAGGYYFALFASTEVGGQGLPGTIQATTLLYLKVDGELVRTSVMEHDSVPKFVMGNEIPYKFDVKNTGNVHFSANFYGRLDGLLFGKGVEYSAGHLLMPGTVRDIGGSVPAPLLPGVYKLTYGYKVDFAPITVARTAYVVFVPPWSLVALLLLVLGGRWLWQKKRTRSPSKTDKTDKKDD